MDQVTTKKPYTSFTVKNEEFVVVPKKEFLKLKRDYTKIENEEYPKLYTEVDEEWTWDTIDFWPEGIASKDLLLIHEELQDGTKV